MKIAFVLDDGLDKPDGVQQYIITLGRWLRQEGHTVHYIVGETHRRDIGNVHSMSKNLSLNFNGNRVSIPWKTKKKAIQELLKKEKFDVLHVQMPYSPQLGARIINYAPAFAAIIGTFHIVPYSRTSAMATRVLRLMLWSSLRRFDSVVSVSQPAARFAKKSLGVKSRVIPNAIQLNTFASGRRIKKYDDGKVNIVFLGRLVERKGCMHLLKALQKLHAAKQLVNVRVLICGKGPQRDELMKYVRVNQLGSMVHFTGFLNELEKPDYLASANIAVFPSTSGESFGIVLLEAMAAGSEVVIAGNNAGYKSVLSPLPNQLVRPTDTAKFVRVLKHFIINGKARQHAKRQQMRLVQRYDVKIVGRQIFDEYKSAVAKKEHKHDN